jgi:hypothetical protein
VSQQGGGVRVGCSQCRRPARPRGSGHQAAQALAEEAQAGARGDGRPNASSAVVILSPPPPFGKSLGRCA